MSPTHHKRPGGRWLEFLVLLGLLGQSIALAFLGLIVAVWLLDNLGLHGGGGKSGQLLLVGPVVGLIVSGRVWKMALKFYKYDTATLKPIDTKEIRNDGSDH